MSGIFTARYGGKCAACGDGIRVGDECTWADDSVVHIDCEAMTAPRGAAETICSRCFLTTCDCERDS